MTKKELTVGELTILEHALGAQSKTPGYRNYFATDESGVNYKIISDLIGKGLMCKGRGIPGGMFYFHVTKEGQDLIGCHETR
jgi:hypothetical protein